MNVRPLRDRVLVKRVEAQEQRIGGIASLVLTTGALVSEIPQKERPVPAAHGPDMDDY